MPLTKIVNGQSVEMSADEESAFLAMQETSSTPDYQIQARHALSESDLTIIRCTEHGISVPTDWTTYRSTLRDIIAGRSSGPLPSIPDYPAGT